MDLKTGVRIRVNGDAEISNDASWLKMFPNSIETVKPVRRSRIRDFRGVSRR
jgi:hypothetical protein